MKWEHVEKEEEKEEEEETRTNEYNETIDAD